MKRALTVSWVISVSVGCGGQGNPGYALEVGGDDGGNLGFVAGDAAGSQTLDAYIEQGQVAVNIVTLSCAGDCATVQAVGIGGTAPYSYAWENGSTNPVRQVCPASDTAYSVKVTDTGKAGEFPRPPQTAKASVAADVLSCPDGGSAVTGPCDELDAVSPSGANPNRPWTYGWTPSLGGTFSAYTEYLNAPTSSQITLTGLVAWTSGVSGVEINPAATFNPSASPDDITVNGSTWAVPAHQFMLHPGPTGQYSVARWTATAAATYLVTSTFVGLAQAPAMTTTDVHVQHGGTDLPGGTGAIHVNGGGNEFTTSLVVSVVPGDTIDFAVGDGGDSYLSDTTGLTAKVCRMGAGDGG